MKKIFLLITLVLVFGLLLAQNANSFVNARNNVSDAQNNTASFRMVDIEESSFSQDPETTRNATPLPFYTNFVPPSVSGWSLNVGQSSGVYTLTNDNGDATNYFCFWGTAGTHSATTPLLGPIPATAFIDFNFFVGTVSGSTVNLSNFTGTENLTVAISTEASPNNFTTIHTINNSMADQTGFGTPVNLNISQFADQNIYIRFQCTSATTARMVGFTNLNVWGASDDILPAILVSPSNNAQTGTNITLSWRYNPTGVVPTSYKYHFGTTSNPPLVSTLPATQTTVAHPNLNPQTQYYWRIIPVADGVDAEDCPVWTFTTLTSDVVAIGWDDYEVFAPVFLWNDLSYSQVIYYPSEINTSGDITKISYYFDGGAVGSNNKNWVIYMGHTNLNIFTDGWIPHTGNNFTQVFSGVVPLNAAGGWVEITLQTPFSYNNTQNLVIATNQITTGWIEDTGMFLGSLTENRTILVAIDGNTPINVNNLPTQVSGQYDIIGLDNTIPNIRMTFADTSFSNDLAATNLTGTSSLVVGTQYTYTVTVENVGNNAASGYNVRLMHGTNQLATVAGTNLASGATTTFNLTWTPATAGAYTIFGEIVWAADENPDNNKTNDLNVTVNASSEHTISIGDPAYAFDSMNLPFNHTWENYLSQTIYRQSEIGVYGSITKIEYLFHNDGIITTPQPMKIYMGTTNIEEFTGGWYGVDWVPFSQMTLVFDGAVATHIPGWNDVPIVLDTPYPYTTGNLVVMFHRTDGINYPGWENTFKATTTSNTNSMRSFSYSNGYEPIDPENLPYSGTELYHYPNINITFALGGMGEITGTVSSASGPIANAIVSMVETGRSVQTNAQGQYLMDFVQPGSHEISAIAHGYSATVHTVNVSENQVTTQNFTLSPLPTFNVTGRVLASDTGQGLAGATVKISGYDEFPEVTTNSTGNFTVPAVYILRNYTATFTHERFITRTHNFSMGTGITDIGEHTLEEYAAAPTDVVATMVGDNVVLEWVGPQIGNTPEVVQNSSRSITTIETDVVELAFTNDARSNIANPRSHNNRAFESFNIYRTISGNSWDPETWTFIGNTTGLSYTDTSWAETPYLTSYIYAITAVYTDDNVSGAGISNAVLKVPDYTVYMGNPGSGMTHTEMPFSYMWEASVAQAIFHEDEMTEVGNIEEIIYNITSAQLPPAGINHRIWMTTTTQSTFVAPNTWIPYDQFDLVFEGTIPITETGRQNIHIPLDVPFNYTQGNLVIMTERQYTVTWASGLNWQVTPVDDDNIRVFRISGNFVDGIDLENLGSYAAYQQVR